LGSRVFRGFVFESVMLVSGTCRICETREEKTWSTIQGCCPQDGLFHRTGLYKKSPARVPDG
jgi:hypothetical protein